MPTGPKGEKRPADVIGNSVKVMRIATGEETVGLFLEYRSVASALGRHKDRARALEFPADRQWVACETGHLDLPSRSDVY